MINPTKLSIIQFSNDSLVFGSIEGGFGSTSALVLDGNDDVESIVFGENCMNRLSEMNMQSMIRKEMIRKEMIRIDVIIVK